MEECLPSPPSDRFSNSSFVFKVFSEVLKFLISWLRIFQSVTPQRSVIVSVTQSSPGCDRVKYWQLEFIHLVVGVSVSSSGKGVSSVDDRPAVTAKLHRSS